MDISMITDIDKLKSLAYDQIAAKEQAQSNLNTINARISEVMSSPPGEVDTTDKQKKT